MCFRRVGWLCLLLFLPAVSRAAAPPPVSTEELIDRLRLVRDPDLGYGETDNPGAFLPLDRSDSFRIGLLLQSPVVPAEPLRALVRRGAAAVPLLVAHLNDKRATRLAALRPEGKNETLFGDGTGLLGLSLNPLGENEGRRSYTITVGDLCYVALGQIVNRDLTIDHYFALHSPLFSAGTPLDPFAWRTKKWGRLTPARHRDTLLHEARKAVDVQSRIEACKRLAYYYPEAFEPLAFQLLALPTCIDEPVGHFIHDGLSGAKTAKDRRKILADFLAKHGQVYREAILRKLFADLPFDEFLEGEPADPCDEMQALVDLFGFKPGFRFADRPDFMKTLVEGEKAALIRETLIYDDSPRIDRAVQKIFTSTKEDDLALACMERLIGRGFDRDIERYCRSRLREIEADERKPFQEMLDRMGWTRLHAAVARGQAGVVLRLLDAGARPDARSRSGETPLHLAARAGDARIMRLLLGRKSRLEGKDRDGLTAAQVAAMHDHDGVVRLLLEQGCAIPDILVAAIAGRADRVARFLKADADTVWATTEGPRTALLLAVANNRTKVAQVLLAHKADAYASVGPGWRPLHEAAARGLAPMVQLLIDNGEIHDAPLDETRLTPLQLAARNGHEDVVRILLENKAEIDFPDSQGRTALYMATGEGHAPVVRLLLKFRASPRPAAKGGPYPLHAAASSGRADLVKLLLEAAADTETRDPDRGETALHLAVRHGHEKVIHLLLARGARINARDGMGRTPLYIAVERDQTTIARLLLENHADPNVATKAGAMPLHVTAYLGKPALARLLLRHKADPEGSAPGGTPLHLAADRGHLDIVRILVAHKVNLLARGFMNSTPLHAAALGGHVEICKLLLEKGVPVDCTDGDGHTALEYALRNQKRGEAMAKFLLRHKAHIRAATGSGWQPLHTAARGAFVRGAALLLDHKADVNAREKEEGRTPLHLAIANEVGLDDSTEAHALPIVKLLLERKADVTVKDAKGRTPLALAIEMKFEQVCALLRKHGARRANAQRPFSPPQ